MTCEKKGDRGGFRPGPFVRVEMDYLFQVF